MHDEEHNKKPRRRVVLTLVLGADDRDAMIRSLQSIALEMQRGHLRGDATSGGYSDGYTLRVTEDPDITHDSYIAAIDPDGAEEDAKGR